MWSLYSKPSSNALSHMRYLLVDASLDWFLFVPGLIKFSLDVYFASPLIFSICFLIF